MILSHWLCRILTLLLLGLLVTESMADVPSPWRAKRKHEVESWRQKFPESVPKFSANLQSNKSLQFLFTFKTPAEYTISVNREQLFKGRVNKLTGADLKESLALKENEDLNLLVIFDYTLFGVNNTRFGPKLTNKKISARLVKRYVVHWSNKKAVLTEKYIGTPEYHMLQRDHDL